MVHQDRTASATGTAAGIGAAVALPPARRGVRLALAVWGEPGLAESSNWPGSLPSGSIHRLDPADPKAVCSVVASIPAAWRPLPNGHRRVLKRLYPGI